MPGPFREKRRSVRRRVFFEGEILVDPDLPPVECHIKNVSSGGACIVALRSDLLPDRFDLLVHKTNERRHVVMTWKQERRFGVAYRPEQPGRAVVIRC